jgi:uncharacterized protein (TIGR03435 family)
MFAGDFMRRRLLLASTICTAAVFGQNPAFDVASVRVSQSDGEHRGPRENIQVSPDGVIMRSVSMRNCTRWAYHVTPYQVTGPDWINSQRYDINAKAAGQMSEDQLRVMMQTLLSERFKMEAHRQTKEMQAYLLQVGKNGIKVKESGTDGEIDVKPDQQRMSVSIQRATMSHLIDVLANVFRAPIIDQTGLAGKYDVTVNMAKYIPDMSGGRGPGGEPAAPPDPQAIIMRGLQEELGLKLEPKKMAVDLVIIDHAEKVPVEN